jgi:signal transduction histidine kinase
MSPRGPMRLRAVRLSPPVFLRVYLLVGAVILAVALLLYFHSLALRVESQTEAMSDLVTHVIAFTTLAVKESPDSLAQNQFQSVIRSLNFPVVVTDVNGLPLAWNKRVGAKTMSIDQILTEDLDHPSPPLAHVLAETRTMDRRHPPVPMFTPGTDTPLLYLHYGPTPLVEELRLIPIVTIIVAALFGIVGLLMLRSLKRAEQGFIWAGMAKETAHQMGTPLSSLMGWMEVLKDEARVGETEAAVPRDLYEEIVKEIGRDADRLHRVAARFSQIGSRPRLERASIEPVVRSTVDYFRRRFPRDVELNLEIEPGLPEVAMNQELIGWVLENLIKNSLNAADKGAGRVGVRVRPLPAKKGVAVSVRDNGRGVDAGMERQIFRPGVSTRQRGWGLGLPLSRRIVEEYHRGRLDLTWSEPGAGAEFTVILPAAPAGG